MQKGHHASYWLHIELGHASYWVWYIVTFLHFSVDTDFMLSSDTELCLIELLKLIHISGSPEYYFSARYSRPVPKFTECKSTFYTSS